MFRMYVLCMHVRMDVCVLACFGFALTARHRLYVADVASSETRDASKALLGSWGRHVRQVEVT